MCLNATCLVKNNDYLYYHMNLKNLMMWGVIIFLIVGLFQLFQNPDRVVSGNKIAFSKDPQKN